MRKVLGYGYKIEEESLEEAVDVHTGTGSFYKNKKEAIRAIKNDKDRGDIHKDEKCKIFKVVVETV